MITGKVENMILDSFINLRSKENEEEKEEETTKEECRSSSD